MSRPFSPVERVVRSTLLNKVIIGQHHAWIATTRIVCLIVVLINVVAFLVSLPVYYNEWFTLSNPYIDPAVVRANLARLSISLKDYAAYSVGVAVVFAMTNFGVAALIVWRQSARPMALLIALVLVSLGAGFSGTMDALTRTHYLWLNLSRLLGIFGPLAFTIVWYLFPDGQWVPGWTRVMTIGLIAWQALDMVLLGLGVVWREWSPLLLFLESLAWVGSMLFAQIYRYRRVSEPVQRQQTKWVVFGFTAALTGYMGIGLVSITFPWYNQPGSLSDFFNTAAVHFFLLLIPISIGIAVLRYRLWDIDPIINRTLVYTALTACVIGIYVLVVGYFGAFFQVRNNPVVSLLAAALVAVLFQPLRERLQRGVNRLMYGKRDEPYAVISQLGQRLHATLAPDAVLPTIVETVREALKLPYVAISLNVEHKAQNAEQERTERGEIVAESGERSDALRSMLYVLPLRYQHETVGELVLAPRSPGESFSAADRKLLDDLARQAGVAVHAVRLTADLQHLNDELQRARTDLVTAREEERRRLRRDLHDGIGSVLASLNLRAGAIRSLLNRDPSAADALAVEQQQTIKAAIGDVRRLVHELRPPALDELGLVAAIKDLAARCRQLDTGSTLSIAVEVNDPLPALPAAAEVAAYRIVQEALTNVAKHAQARWCRVRLAVDDGALLVEIVDNGVGMSNNRQPGVGLHSMRERALELGGTCVVERAAGGGTRVLARLPLA